MLLPGAVRYGDVGGLLALHHPQPLWLGESVPPLTATAFAGDPKAIATAGVSLNDAGLAAAGWIVI